MKRKPTYRVRFVPVSPWSKREKSKRWHIERKTFFGWRLLARCDTHNGALFLLENAIREIRVLRPVVLATFDAEGKEII